MKTRIITAIAILAVVIPALFFGGFFKALLVGFIISMGGFEWMNVNAKEHRIPFVIQVIAIVICSLSLLIPQNYINVLFAASGLLFLSIPVFLESFHAKESFNILSYIFFFHIVATAFLKIHGTNPNLIWFMLVATYGCDTGAYFAGRFFGKHKLNERISPKKTIEGSIGGCILGTLLATGFGLFVLNEYHIFFLVIASFLMTIFGQVGDLAFSAIKRNYQI